MTATCFTDPGTNPYAGITTIIPGRVGVPLIEVYGGFSIGNNFEGELPQTGNTFQWTDNFTKTFRSTRSSSAPTFVASASTCSRYYNVNG